MKQFNNRVLVLTTSFPTQKFPVGMHVYNKCKFLVKKGIQTTVLTPHYPGEKFREINDGINIIRFPYFWPLKFQKVAYNQGLVQNLRKSLLAKIQLPLFGIFFMFYGIKHGKNKDIIHAHWFPAGLIGVFIKAMYKKKLVLMMHHSNKPNGLYKFILKNTDFLFANSSYVLDITNKIYPVKNQKVLPVPIDYTRFKPQPNTKHIREQLGIPEDSIFLFTVGRFIGLKGFEYLIEAVSILVHTYKKNNIALQIAGQGPLEKKYRELIRDFRIDDYVLLIGYIPNTEIHKYYNEADIFVIPSVIDENGETEGFGVVSLEANACETPVIASAVGGIVDVIEDGYNGFLVAQKKSKQIAEKIIELVDNKALRKQMGINGRKKVTEQFNWDNVTNEIIKIYDGFITK